MDALEKEEGAAADAAAVSSSKLRLPRAALAAGDRQSDDGDMARLTEVDKTLGEYGAPGADGAAVDEVDSARVASSSSFSGPREEEGEETGDEESMSDGALERAGVSAAGGDRALTGLSDGARANTAAAAASVDGVHASRSASTRGTSAVLTSSCFQKFDQAAELSCPLSLQLDDSSSPQFASRLPSGRRSLSTGARLHLPAYSDRGSQMAAAAVRFPVSSVRQVARLLHCSSTRPLHTESSAPLDVAAV